jgi:thioredoxin type arsenate reductase
MPSVVFLCVANSARSQMAEGLARASAPDGWHVYSAGSRPTQLNPYAAAVLGEVNIDASDQHSKGLDDVPLAEADWVITLCAEEECPVGMTKGQKLHWPLPDPAGAALDEAGRFRAIRDQIKERIDRFWTEVTV